MPPKQLQLASQAPTGTQLRKYPQAPDRHAHVTFARRIAGIALLQAVFVLM
jgi:hypothetical protein